MKNLLTKFDNRAFTLVETLVAVSIFSIAILALLVVLTQSISNTNYAKSKIIATYLAQEGIEYIRNMRDSFVLFDPVSTQDGWNAFFAKLTGASCHVANGCYFDDADLDYSDGSQAITEIDFTACGASCPMMLYDSVSGKYGYESSGVNSGFTRKIAVSQISANEIKVLSTVFWTQGSGTYSMVLSESVFNWAE